MMPLEQLAERYAQCVGIFWVQEFQQVASQACAHLEPGDLFPGGVQEAQATCVIGLEDDLFEVFEQNPITAFGFAGLEQQTRP